MFLIRKQLRAYFSYIIKYFLVDKTKDLFEMQTFSESCYRFILH